MPPPTSGLIRGLDNPPSFLYPYVDRQRRLLRGRLHWAARRRALFLFAVQCGDGSNLISEIRESRSVAILGDNRLYGIRRCFFIYIIMEGAVRDGQ